MLSCQKLDMVKWAIAYDCFAVAAQSVGMTSMSTSWTHKMNCLKVASKLPSTWHFSSFSSLRVL